MIYSPSYKRAGGVKTHLILPEVYYCVHEFEAEEYLQKGYKVKVLPDSIRGSIARVRSYIKREFIKEKGIMIDDDVEAIKIWEEYEGRFYNKNIDDLQEFIELGFLLCKETGCNLWGVNILGDKGSYREYTPFSFTNTVSGSFMGFLNNELDFDENFPLKEDYDFCIQTLNKYRKLLRINYVHLVKKDHGNKGGCADYRTVEKEKEQMRLLQKKWGKKIIKMDEMLRSDKKRIIDINPIIKIPIKGV